VKLHGNAKLTPVQRRLLVARVLEEHWTFADAADAAGVSERTVYRWVRRWRDGDHELDDRSSAPKRVYRTPVRTVRLIEMLRRTRMSSPKIAAKLRMAVSTVCAVLARIGLNRVSKLGPPEPPNRYERRRPGELIHVDIKKLGRFVRPGHRVLGRTGKGVHTKRRGQGWDFVHVAIDDHSRVAYVEILDSERAEDATAFLERAIDWFADLGVRVRSVMTDNGSCYISRNWAATCKRRRITHLRTRPNRPRTNGKAERLIQTLQREWAYAAVYRTSAHRNRALQPWMRFYNHRRPHGSLGHQPPASRLPTAA
jgi:transposase InsO family protein